MSLGYEKVRGLPGVIDGLKTGTPYADPSNGILFLSSKDFSIVESAKADKEERFLVGVENKNLVLSTSPNGSSVLCQKGVELCFIFKQIFLNIIFKV